jgi:hypothetical protein
VGSSPIVSTEKVLAPNVDDHGDRHGGCDGGRRGIGLG